MGERFEIAAGDGCALAGERWPGAGPVIVLPHAGVADQRAWTDVAADLNRDGREVIAYHRRGFGETAP
jgi:pimeloyl-ACP methyl ester carboxylesterase